MSPIYGLTAATTANRLLPTYGGDDGFCGEHNYPFTGVLSLGLDAIAYAPDSWAGGATQSSNLAMLLNMLKLQIPCLIETAQEIYGSDTTARGSVGAPLSKTTLEAYLRHLKAVEIAAQDLQATLKENGPQVRGYDVVLEGLSAFQQQQSLKTIEERRIAAKEVGARAAPLPEADAREHLRDLRTHGLRRIYQAD